MRLPEGAHGELWQTREVRDIGGITQGENDHDRLRRKPACDEAEDLGRCPVEPLPVIDQADQWLGFGNVGEEREDGKPDEEPIRDRAKPQSKRRGQCLALWTRQTFELIEERRAELVEPGEGQFHLRLHPGRAHDSTTCGVPKDVVEQGALADAGRASHRDGGARAGSCVCDQPIQPGAFLPPSDEQCPACVVDRTTAATPKAVAWIESYSRRRSDRCLAPGTDSRRA